MHFHLGSLSGVFLVVVIYSALCLVERDKPQERVFRYFKRRAIRAAPLGGEALGQLKHIHHVRGLIFLLFIQS